MLPFYSAMHKKRYKPKFMFKGLKINFLGFFLRAFERALKNGDIATKPKSLINLFRFYDKTKTSYQNQQ